MKLIAKNRCLLLGIFAAFLTLVAMSVLYAPSTWANSTSDIGQSINQ